MCSFLKCVECVGHNHFRELSDPFTGVAQDHCKTQIFAIHNYQNYSYEVAVENNFTVGDHHNMNYIKESHH